MRLGRGEERVVLNIRLLARCWKAQRQVLLLAESISILLTLAQSLTGRQSYRGDIITRNWPLGSNAMAVALNFRLRAQALSGAKAIA